MNKQRIIRWSVGLSLILIGLAMVTTLGWMTHQALLESRISALGVRFQDMPDLAAAFWRGKLSVPVSMLQERTYSDAFVWQNRVYWPFGPMAAVIMMPFVWLASDIFPTIVVNMILVVAAAWLVFAIARQQKMTENNSAWIALAYSMGSAVTPLMVPLATCWGVQLVANIFLLAALYVHLAKHGPMMTGLFLALALATRPMSVLGLSLFILHGLVKEKKNLARKIALLLTPLVIAGLFIGYYNYARFGNPIQSGYRLQWNYYQALVERMDYGTIDLHYVPTNLWYFLLAPPKMAEQFPFVVPDPMGLGLLFSCPYLIYLFIKRRRWRQFIVPLAAAAIGLIPALSYYASGFSQIGYRYAVDVYPLIFLALIIALAGQLPRPAKALITVAIVAHVCWMVGYFT